MYMKHETYPAALLELVTVANTAARAIPPLFPLTASVAVNPYLGQSSEPISHTVARMAHVSGSRVVAPQSLWADALADGDINQNDLDAAMRIHCADKTPAQQAEIRQFLTGEDSQTPEKLPGIAELAAKVSGIDWPSIIDERIGVWAASYFDTGQALWPAARTGGPFIAWREFASRDLTPEIHGLRGFGAFVAATPRSTWRMLGRANETIGITPEAAPTVFHQVLMNLGGWSQYARYLMWQAELAGENDTTTVELLTIRLVFEEALFEQYKHAIADEWSEILTLHSAPIEPSLQQLADIVVQEAAERAHQRMIAKKLLTTHASDPVKHPKLQAVFCIDVRSEVYRRALEAQSPEIETFGVAGFFGIPTSHTRLGSDISESQSPVLLKPVLTSSDAVNPTADQSFRFAARAKRAWGRFKLAAVSSFAFVEATGPIYAGKLVQDAFGIRSKNKTPKLNPTLDPTLGLKEKAAIARQALKAISLTKTFAPTVLLVGHGANVVNNPHASTLNCGACGGHSGEVNARLMASLLNEPEIRDELSRNGIEIPQTTVFLAALHDTTTDKVTVFENGMSNGTSAGLPQEVSGYLERASDMARTERSVALPRASDNASFFRRATDWAELRPEWGLAGCNSFIAARRAHTSHIALNGQAFLHSYDWREDNAFSGLETLMTAPVVVASWISMQYFGSAVDPSHFGGGNKTLHNAVGGIGVLEGNGGSPRSGLPMQSIHDGTKLRHMPLRLSVIIQAPKDAITTVLMKHDALRQLFDNGWLHLLAMDDQGNIVWRYVGSGSWEAFEDLAHSETAIAAE